MRWNHVEGKTPAFSGSIGLPVLIALPLEIIAASVMVTRFPPAAKGRRGQAARSLAITLAGIHRLFVASW